MKAIITHIEQPILFATGRAMAFVYRKFGISPRRQVPGWEMAVSAMEFTILCFVIALLVRSGERFLVYVLPITAISMLVDAVSNCRSFRKLSNDYRADDYRKALTEAERHRRFGVYLRGISLVLPLFAAGILPLTLPREYTWVGWAATLYYVAYVSKFYVRACEPPRPDEGGYSSSLQPEMS